MYRNFYNATENIKVFLSFRICPENGIMEWRNAGILVFKRKIAILILSVNPAGGYTINPTLLSPLRAGGWNPLLHHSNCVSEAN